MIINHNNQKYSRKRQQIGNGRYNGAYYYSIEICKYIIPQIKTDRNWVTVNTRGDGADHAIVFIHNNKNPESYSWLKEYKDLILVCGIPETCAKVMHLGHPIYLPLSVNVKEVASHRCMKTRDTAYIGRKQKRVGIPFPATIDFISGLQRDRFLDEVAKYRKVYAIGRSAIEAMILDCEILPFDKRFPDPSRWKIMDCSEAAQILQKQLDEIDG